MDKITDDDEVATGRNIFGVIPNLHEEYADAYVQELQNKILNYAKGMKNPPEHLAQSRIL